MRAVEGNVIQLFNFAASQDQGLGKSLLKVINADDKGAVAWHATLVDYAARHISGEAVAGDDALSVGWFTLEDLQELGLWSETARIIRKSAQIAHTLPPR